MASSPDHGPGSGRLTAVLGPTNTGKTFLAMERLAAHRSGMIGFPLRLLARENYEQLVKIKGAASVALITGEERILPPGATHFVCTVESMPLDRSVAFLAVDEIQLAADAERGHVFTDRLLHARGDDETMFLGADTVRPLLRTLIPRAEIIARERFSKLSYSGFRKLTKLPPRCAVVAFSASDVYAIAELLRRQRGGTAVVLGALSPRTRNAQVALYQAGEVDYLVATDAIGMGLNMDVDHVAFARLIKFDGDRPRRLRPAEMAQIAGRAGRHRRDGTFGVTEEVTDIDAEVIERIEEHRFEPLQSLMWRNNDLHFDSPASLLRSLEMRPPHTFLIRTRDADDHVTLQAMLRDDEIAGLAKGRSAVRLLWEVAQVPDFRKMLNDTHARLLGQIFRYLIQPGGRLPVDWTAAQVERLNHTDGDIDALVARIAHIRTWTYISHRADWLADPLHWQERSRAIEDRLSDALHERLTQRFIDRRSALLVRSRADGRSLLASIDANGAVLVEGYPAGQLDGLHFTPDAAARGLDGRQLMSAARKALADEIQRRVGKLEASPDSAFMLQSDALVAWQGAVVGRLGPGSEILTPLVQTTQDDLLDPGQRDRVRTRLASFVAALIADAFAPLLRLRKAPLDNPDWGGPARGLAFQLSQSLGTLPRRSLGPMVDGLPRAGRLALQGLGVRCGLTHVFMPSLLRPRAQALRALLYSVYHGLGLPAPVPLPGQVSVVASPGHDAAYYQAIGFARCHERAVRVDMLDRVEQSLRQLGRDSPGEHGFALPAALAMQLGCSVAELEPVVMALGAKRVTPEAGEAATPALFRLRSAARRRAVSRPPGPEPAPDHPFAVLQQLRGRG